MSTVTTMLSLIGDAGRSDWFVSLSGFDRLELRPA
jgi:hypothetical protein